MPCQRRVQIGSVDSHQINVTIHYVAVMLI